LARKEQPDPAKEMNREIPNDRKGEGKGRESLGEKEGEREKNADG